MAFHFPAKARISSDSWDFLWNKQMNFFQHRWGSPVSIAGSLTCTCIILIGLFGCEYVDGDNTLQRRCCKEDRQRQKYLQATTVLPEGVRHHLDLSAPLVHLKQRGTLKLATVKQVQSTVNICSYKK